MTENKCRHEYVCTECGKALWDDDGKLIALPEGSSTRRRERLELAGRAMQAYLESFANATELDLRWVPMAFRVADALLAELDKEAKS